MICKDRLKMLNDIPKWKTVWHIREDEYSTIVLTDRLEIVIIELEKITKMIYKGKIKDDSKIAIWNKFFLNPKGIGGKEMEKNEDVKEAKEKYDDLITDMSEARLALSRQMYVMDMASCKNEGYSEGLEDGKKSSQIEIAKELLIRKMPIEEISKITKLKKKEIENLMATDKN